MPATTFLANQILNYNIGQTGYTLPSNFYIGLSTTQPNANGTGITEPTGGGYSRVSVANNKQNFSVSAMGTLSNLAQIEYNESTGNWGTVAYILIYNAITGGDLLWYGAFVSSKIVQSGTALIIAPNTLTFSLT